MIYFNYQVMKQLNILKKKEPEEPEEPEEEYGKEPMYLISYNVVYRLKGREHKINQDDKNLAGIRKKDLGDI